MKKLAALLCALILILSIPVAAHADDEVYTEGTLYYTIGDETITIVGCFGSKQEVTVPASIAGYPVNTIAKGAFTDNRSIKKLYLPDVITTIEDGAIADSIQVIYNANTAHPQNDPPDIVTGREPILVPADPDDTQKPKSDDKKTPDATQPNASGDKKETSASGSGSSSGTGGDLIMEDDVDLSNEEASEDSSAEKSPGKTSDNSDISAKDPASTEKKTSEKSSDDDSADASGGSGSTLPIMIVVIVVIAAAAAVFFVIRHKKKSGK